MKTESCEIRIRGMICRSCTDEVSGMLLRTKGVVKASVSYRKALDEMEANTGNAYDTLYIVGGGAKNKVLNRMAEGTTGKKIVALPIEATALGNLKIQLEGTK